MNDSSTAGTGYLRLRSYTAGSAVPVPHAAVTVTLEDGTALHLDTGADAMSGDAPIPCPPRACSLEEGSSARPYAVCRVQAQAPGFRTLTISGVQIFDGQVSIQPLALLPAEDGAARAVSIAADACTIPPHALSAGAAGSGRAPLPQGSAARILSQPIVPSTITVHLGKPSASAQNVTIPFADYIKNVASSEVYPTWPEQALRANIHAQISLALNRIYTEWYRAKGYSFDITNSTGYDQYYVHGRDIFEVMSRITDDIFNTYVRRAGTVNPYYTEYCDGKTVTCRGMKQWGTVTLANEGRDALSILRYYYGDDIEIVRTNNIGRVPESYPGAPLRVGSTGESVRTIQRQLSRIAKDYPFFGTLEADGVFGAGTAEVVKKFQKQFSLAQDGIVGRSTWYKVSSIYVAVKKLAQLTSEGEAPSGGLVDGAYPGAPLRVGSSGIHVEQVQFWLNAVGRFVPSIPALALDGVYGSGTQAAVRAFQRWCSLAEDGVVGPATWAELYARYTSIHSDVTPPGVSQPGEYPGAPLRTGSSGGEVRLLQFWLHLTARANSAIPLIAADGVFGEATAAAVRAFQSFYGLAADGVAGRLTWNKAYEVYTDLANGLLGADQRPGTYPGTALRTGSSGRAVKELQYYLYLLSAYYGELPVIAYDGIFGLATEQAVRAYQALFGLAQDGVAGRVTWDSVYAQFSALHGVTGSVRALRMAPWPGSDTPDSARAQWMLSYIGTFYDNILPCSAEQGAFGAALSDAVKSFQQAFGLPVTGAVNEATWDALSRTLLSLAAGAAPALPADGAYPGFALAAGSAGGAVRALQGYMNGIASRFGADPFVAENGIFDEAMLAAVRRFAQGFGLPCADFVGRDTWETLYSYYVRELEE